MHTTDQLYEMFTASNGLTTDSRSVPEGSIFLALRGDRFDGNEYALKALAAGARAAIVDREALAGQNGCYYVPNALTTLQKIAHHHRKQMSIPVIGITGTNGKTTTKELIHSVVSQEYNAVATIGNLNNHIGVPLTLLRFKKDTEVAIVEMGANHGGEIAWLANICAPSIGIVTNVGEAHLEGFGTAGQIWDTKMGLYRYIDAHDGMCLINMDELSLGPLMDQEFRKSCYFGSTQLPNGQSLKFIDEKGRIKIRLQGGCDIFTHLYGDHNRHNILTAICVGMLLNVPMQKIKTGLESYVPSINRSQLVVEGSNTYYMDAYNANPTSMQVALKFFDGVNAVSKVMILGDMLELGRESKKYHREVLEQIAGMQTIDEIMLVGNCFAALSDVIQEFGIQPLFFDDVGDLRDYLKIKPISNASILVKGSRSIGLEKVLRGG